MVGYNDNNNNKDENINCSPPRPSSSIVSQNSDNLPPYLTRINDKYYDLTNFNHPGGKVAISCSYQRDATELFYSYHQFKDQKKINQILKQYEVIDNKYEISKFSKFQWKETISSSFYCDLMEAVTPYFKHNGTKLNLQKGIEIFILFWLSLIQYIYLLKGYSFALISFPIIHFAFIANVCHDGSHFAFSNSPILNDYAAEFILFVSPKYYWMHQHIIGHHCYTSIPYIDPDISVPLFRHHPDYPLLFLHKYQYLFNIILPLIRSPIFYLVTSFRCYKDKFFLGGHHLAKSAHLNCFSMIPSALLFLFLIYFMPLFCLGLNLKGIIFSVLPWMIFNLYYMNIASLGHNTPETDTQFNSNYFIHEVITTHNFSTNNYFAYLLTGGLNFQIEHHLFPVSYFLSF